MTPQLDTLAELLAKAIDGPWQDNGSHIYGPDPLRLLIAQCYYPRGHATNEIKAIVAAVNFLRDNLPAIREQADEVERLRAALRFYADRAEPRAWCRPVLIDAQHPDGRRPDGPVIPSEALRGDKGEWARFALNPQENSNG